MSESDALARYVAEIDNLRAAVSYAVSVSRYQAACELLDGIAFWALMRPSFEILEWLDVARIPAGGCQIGFMAGNSWERRWSAAGNDREGEGIQHGGIGGGQADMPAGTGRVGRLLPFGPTTPSFFMRNRSVFGWMPRRSAAFPAPLIRPPHNRRTASMCSR